MQLFDDGQSVPYTKIAENIQGERIESLSVINRAYRRGHCGKGQMSRNIWGNDAPERTYSRPRLYERVAAEAKPKLTG